MDTTTPFAAIRFLPELELSPEDSIGCCVRITAMLVSYDLSANRALFMSSNSSSTLLIDTFALGAFEHTIGSLYQVIGTIDWMPQDIPLPPNLTNIKLILRATLIRNVDGLDVQMYEKAVNLRRKLERER